MRKRIAIVVLIALVAVAGYFTWRYVAVPSSATRAALSGSGTIEADEVSLSPLTSGRIVSAPATEGARVKKGDVLFRIDDSVAKLQAAQAAAGVNAAKAARDQAKRDKKSSADISAAQAQLDQARAQLSLAQLSLSYCVVASPVDGTLLQIAMDAGENATPGKTLATIARLDRLTVAVYIPETEIGKVRLGSAATASDDSGGTHTGTVTFVSSQAEFTPSQIETKDERVKLVYKIRIAITGSGDGLKPGMPVDVVIGAK